MIPLVDLTARHKKLKRQELSALSRVIEGGGFVLGPEVAQFERAFASYTQTKYAVGVGSGTDALIIALKALDIGLGDEVIVPAFTFVSTAFSVLAVGARPVFIDVEPITLNLDPSQLPEAVTERTKAIIPVHLYGMPADMDQIMRFARSHNISVIEDAAQAHGSRFREKSAGSIGIVGCFSFYPSKNLGAIGDAGAVITSNARIATRLRMFGNLGRRNKYLHALPGFNSRLDSIQAATLSLGLGRLDRDNERRKEIANHYQTLLADLPLTLPTTLPHRLNNYHLFVIRTAYRNRLRAYLATHGIETGIHYPTPLHLQPAFRSLGYRKGTLPVSEKAAQEVLSLPMYPELTPHDMQTVASSIRIFFLQKASLRK